MGLSVPLSSVDDAKGKNAPQRGGRGRRARTKLGADGSLAIAMASQMERLVNAWLSGQRGNRVRESKRNAEATIQRLSDCTLRMVLRSALSVAAKRTGSTMPDDVMRLSADVPEQLLGRDEASLESALDDCEFSLSDVGAAYERLLALTPHIDGTGRATRFTLSDVRSSRRRKQGSFYTPDALVQHVLDAALEPVIDQAVKGMSGVDAERALLTLRLCDPACGSGNFLIAASRRIAARVRAIRMQTGHVRHANDAFRHVAATCMYGVDIDAVAVELCIALLAIEAGDARVVSQMRSHIRCGDALLGAPLEDRFRRQDSRVAADQWCEALSNDACDGQRRLDSSMWFHWLIEFAEPMSVERGGFDVVVGNPPFLNQLTSDTAAARGAAAILCERSGGAVRGYADIASAFLLLAAQLTRKGGFFALVQPQSLLAARDAQRVRDEVTRLAAMRSLWVANERVFEAGVHVCAPAFERDGVRTAALRRFHGAEFEALSPTARADDGQGWAHYVAEASGVPECAFSSSGSVGDVALVTADFRDQYYGLDGFIVEDAQFSPSRCADDDQFPPLVTTGLVDLASCEWGHRPTRILKKTWVAPRIDRARLERAGELGAWLAMRLVPKILLATQTRIIEVCVDEAGRLAPVVPLITIVPRDVTRIWHIAAGIASPVNTAIAIREYAGTAMSADAIKLAAKQVARLPMPAPCPALDEAARALREASAATSTERRHALLRTMASATLDAFDVPSSQHGAMMAWWQSRSIRRIAPTRAKSGASPRPVHEV